MRGLAMGSGARIVSIVAATAASVACDGRTRQPASPGPAIPVAGAGETGQAGPAERVDGEEFSVLAQHESAVRVGVPTQVTVSATPAAGWKINLEYPAKLRVVSAEGLATEKPVFALADAARRDEHELRFEVRVTPESAGERPVEFLFKFGLCDASRCVTRETTLRWAYSVGG